MEIGKFNLIKTEGRARRGEFCTAHGVVQTPVFQNVGTAGAIKGAVDAFDPSAGLTAHADYITEMQKRRHPYEKGVAAREGIEF